jgi:cysteine protease ATG4
LSDHHPETHLKVYINGDGADVYKDTYRRMAMADDGTFTPTLILVGIRLGIDRVTPVYWDSLKAVLRLPQSMGIAG